MTLPLKNNRAFTLVELSIVLVILGLLVGGVLTGQSLIRAAELRAVTTEYNRYVAAAQTFRDKYFAIPVDMANATSFWTTTSNGNGNGMLELATGAGVTGEYAQFWNQLALAGLVEGSYTGISGSSTGDNIPTNSPKSKAGNAYWGAHYNGNFPGSPTWYFAGNYGNYLHVGSIFNGTWADYPAFKPEEAWNIDTKLDDGKPSTGKVMVSGIAACTNSTGVTDTSATYALSTTSIQCGILFLNAF